MFREFLNPWNYAVALLTFVLIRFFLFRILFHLSALFACVILFGFYASFKKLFGKDEGERRSTGVTHLFLSDEEGRAVGKAQGKALRQYSLASASGWKKYRQNSKEPYNTLFFSKIIRNEQMETALRKLLSYVTKDFIHPCFPNYIDFVLHSAVAELYNRALSIDVTQLILIKIVGVVTIHIREVQNAEKLLRASRLPNSRNQEELNRQLAQHYNQGKLHPALNAFSPDTTQHEYAWFRKRLKPFIPLLIPRKETSSGIVYVLLREILITCLLRPIVNNFSQPDYWNQLFDTFGGYLLDQQQQNRLLRKPSEYIPDLLDQGGSSKGDLPSFDVYLRQIGTCTNLPDAYRIRDNIIKEIDAKGVSIVGCAPDDIINGIKVSKTVSYISRLEVAQKRIDKVIANLSAKNKRVNRTDLGDGQLTLNYVLEDSTLLPFFDDYLNMVGRASLLQFYVSVVNFQDQLYIEKSVTTLDDALDPNIVETWDLISVAVNLCDLWKDYMAPDSTPGTKISIFVSPSFLKYLSDYVETLNVAEGDVELNSLGTEKTSMAVKCMLCSMNDVLEVMRTEDFPSFLKHPIGLKLLNRFNGLNNPLRFLRGRSPDRDRASIDSDRSTEDHEEEQQQSFGRKKSMFGFDMLKMPRRNSKSKVMIPEEREDIPESAPIQTENFEVDGELQSIVNSEENSFVPAKKKNRLSPFFGDKESTLKYDVASQGRAFLESFRKKPVVVPGIERDVDQQSPNSSNTHLRAPSEKEIRKPKSSEISTHARTTSFSRGTEKDISKSYESSGPSADMMSKLDHDADDFIQLEIEDNHPSPIDDLINMPQSQIHPFMIILPGRFFNLDESLDKLKADYAKAEMQIKDTDRSNDPEKLKNFHYIERGIWHEMQDILEQKQKIEKAELENGRVSVSIQASHVVKQEGKDYAVYPIQVTRLNSEGTSSGWMILRRYSQFLTLHQDLKAKFPSIMQAYELPGKLISGIMKKRSAFMDSRRDSLEKYIMQLLVHPEICKVQVFRRFLCHPEIIRLLYGDGEADESPTKKNFLRNVVHSVDDTMDTIFQRRNQRNPNFSTEKAAVQTSVFSHNPITREFTAKKEEGEVVSSTAEPILDLFVELFELKGLRRQAVVILIQNLFGDTVERKVTEGLRDSLSQEKMTSIVNTICDNFWPNGVWATLAAPRNEDQKIRTKFEASSKITQLFPEIFGGIVGRQTARKGGVRVCTALQNPRLNQHLMYKILDEILNALFQKL